MRPFLSRLAPSNDRQLKLCSHLGLRADKGSGPVQAAVPTPGRRRLWGGVLRDQGGVARASRRPPSRLRGGAWSGPGGGARSETGGVSPGGSPTCQRAPSAPAGGGRGKSRPGGPAAPRAARADRKSKVAAWGVGRPSAPLSGAHTGSRTGNVDPVHDDRKSKVAAWGVGRPSAALSGARTGSRTGNVGLGNPVGGWAPTRRAATATGTRSRGGSERVREMRRRSCRDGVRPQAGRGDGLYTIIPPAPGWPSEPPANRAPTAWAGTT